MLQEMPEKRRPRQKPEIIEFILRNVDGRQTSIATVTAEKFGISRTAINRYLTSLIERGLITASGKTRARSYRLLPISGGSFTIRASRDIDEDAVWRHKVLPLFKDVPQNVIDICQYGVTEMLNNVFDHSGSPDCILSYKQTYAEIKLIIIDHGIGIFQRIQRDFKLADARSALLELSKGKLTSDKSRHTGEGIFFTSRMFERFAISSDDLFYTRRMKDDFEWLIESGDLKDEVRGTSVFMDISTNATWTTREIFNRYQGDDLRFKKTHIPIKLGRYPNEQLVSRSQAKRILARFDEFNEILLDFDGIEDVGRAFIDEIFRVFRTAHPNIELASINVNERIRKMIESADGGGDTDNEPELPFDRQ
jgi:anti-sigma regulatory factor (Ser/Thr protein kinase)/predicted transcriptional regulator